MNNDEVSCCVEWLFVYLFVEPTSQTHSSRDMLLLVICPVIIKLVITSALLGNVVSYSSTLRSTCLIPLLWHKILEMLTPVLIGRCQNPQCITVWWLWGCVAADQAECPYRPKSTAKIHHVGVRTDLDHIHPFIKQYPIMTPVSFIDIILPATLLKWCQ